MRLVTIVILFIMLMLVVWMPQFLEPMGAGLNIAALHW